MKTELLKELGLDKDAIDKVMAENGKDVEAQKAKTAGVEAERDALKEQLATVQNSLKKFEDVDVDSLKGEVEKLKSDIKAKEDDFNAQLADRDFTDMLNAEIQAAKGKNPKAVMALLDMDALKASKNQKEDATAAIKALSESEAYLFSDTENATPAKVDTGGEHSEPGDMSVDSFTAAAMKGAGLDNGKD